MTHALAASVSAAYSQCIPLSLASSQGIRTKQHSLAASLKTDAPPLQSAKTIFPEPMHGGISEIVANRSAFAALKRDGSIVTWGSELTGGAGSICYAVTNDGACEVTRYGVRPRLARNVTRLYANAEAFAALKSDGSVVSWGNGLSGGDSRPFSNELASGVQDIVYSDHAFLALKQNGGVITWGDPRYGGSIRDIQNELDKGVVQVTATAYGFAALKYDGSVITWGDIELSDDAARYHLREGVRQIITSQSVFVAVKRNGNIVSWGQRTPTDVSSPQNGGRIVAIKTDGDLFSWGGNFSPADGERLNRELRDGVLDVSSHEDAFAALTIDGSLTTWSNDASHDIIPPPVFWEGSLIRLVANQGAFAALTSRGAVITWGKPESGGDSTAFVQWLEKDVINVIASDHQFAAHRSDGSVIVWGKDSSQPPPHSAPPEPGTPKRLSSLQGMLAAYPRYF